MLPPERRLPGVRDLIDQEHYFVIHAPRQVGKTTCFHALARSLAAEGRYAALLTSCEAGQLLSPDLDESLGALLETLRQDAEEDLPPELRPPAADRSLVATIQLRNLLVRWSRQCPRPVVLFLDEIDTLTDEALLSVLRQLRSGYRARPRGFPQALALIGLRDVRDPFNIKVESLTLRNFTAAEVSELYGQHTAETGQEFFPEAKELAFEFTGGHPWLVNALAREVVEKLVPDTTTAVMAENFTAAKEALITRRDPHFESLIDRLRDARVQRVIESILADELLPAGVLDEDLQLVQDLGLVISGPQGLQIANPIYREVIPRAPTAVPKPPPCRAAAP
jgi:hypothetical protein